MGSTRPGVGATTSLRINRNVLEFFQADRPSRQERINAA
jgi:uncharacterized protein (DUF4415 family)